MKANGSKTGPPSWYPNRLLEALSRGFEDRTVERLDLVPLQRGEVVNGVGQGAPCAYFPNDCVVSLLFETASGGSAEISVVGNEGFVGIDALMGAEARCIRAVVQNAGTAYRLPVYLLEKDFDRNSESRRLILRYTQSLMMQMSQMAVCNRHHSITQQVCRRLLISLDRLPDEELSMTHDMIANLLGVRREGVTAAAGRLRDLGVIETRRGHIKVLDRDELEAMSCECYAMLKLERGSPSSRSGSGSGTWLRDPSGVAVGPSIPAPFLPEHGSSAPVVAA
jgi:CRP-like cAMP-binding protein